MGKLDIAGIAGKAVSAGGGIIGGIVGSIAAKKQQQRQHNYNKELMEIQNKYLQENNIKNHQLQMETWRNTNSSAQVAELKKAGLNVGLMSGGAGAGGVTTGTQQGGAPTGGGNYSDYGITSKAMDIGAQAAQQLANIELTKAQTENVKAQTNKTAGIDTELTGMQIQSLSQGIENAKAQEIGTKIDNTLKEVELQVNSETMEETIEAIKYNSRIANKQLEIMSNEAKFSTETYEDKVKLLRANYLKILTDTLKVKSDIKLNDSIIKYAKQYADATTLSAQASMKNAEASEQNANTNYKKVVGDDNRDWKRLEQEEARRNLEEELKKAGLEQQNIKLFMEGADLIQRTIKIWK